MSTAPFSSVPRPEVLARGAQGLAISLIVLFLVTILGSFLPPRLLDPDWQLTLASNLIDNGINLLLAVFMMLLASYLDPNNEALQRRQAQFRTMASWVAIAYLLLAPLQGLAFLNGFDQASSSLVRQTQQNRQAIGSLRDAVINANSLVELQGRLRKLQAPALPADVVSMPLVELKASLLDQLEAKDNILKQNLRQPLVKQLWPTLQKTLRNMVAALVLGLGFASVGTQKDPSMNLLQQWSANIKSLGKIQSNLQTRWEEWREQRLQKREMDQRLTHLRQAQQKTTSQEKNKFSKWFNSKNQANADYIDQIISSETKNSSTNKDKKPK